MKNSLIFSAILAFTFHAAAAQDAWLPPVDFPSNTPLCDNTLYKVVLYDAFNGTSVNTNKWIRYTSRDGMPGGYNGWNLTAKSKHTVS